MQDGGRDPPRGKSNNRVGVRMKGGGNTPVIKEES